MNLIEKVSSLLSAANAKTGESDVTLTDAVQTLCDGYGHGGGLPTGITDIYYDTYTPASEQPSITIMHNKNNTNVLLAAIWVENLPADYSFENNNTIAKYWLKKGNITTRRGGNGFCVGYTWSTTSNYADTQSPNTASYETLTINENSVAMPRAQSGTNGYFASGLTYHRVIIFGGAS